MSTKCQHQNIDITEVVTSRYTHHIRQGSHIETSAGISLEPRQFDVQCQDCALVKSYRYGPGEFGANARPRWLYQYIEKAKKQ